MTQGSENQNFTWGNSLLSGSGESTFYYLQDHLGSPVRLLGNEGNDATLAYDEFGVPEVTANVQGFNNPFGFTGYQMEDASGLQYAQARYYNPNMGRFGAEDPIKDKLNWYGYCNGNPINFIDPRGLVMGPSPGMQGRQTARSEEYMQHIRDRYLTDRGRGQENNYAQITQTRFEFGDPERVEGTHGFYSVGPHGGISLPYVRWTSEDGVEVILIEGGGALVTVGNEITWFEEWVATDVDVTLISADTQLGFRLREGEDNNFVGANIGASLISAGAGSSILIPFTNLSLYTGSTWELGAIGARFGWDASEGRFKIGLSKIVGGYMSFGIQQTSECD